MFGLIVPHEATLTKIDKEVFRSFYCSLCRKIGERSNPARMFLSYDLTFLAILTSALDEDDTPFGDNKRCPIHPLRPTPDINSKHISYAADVSVMLIKEKIKDDISDENKLYQRLMDLLVKDRIQNDDVRKVIKTELDNLSVTEKENILNPDIAGDSFAKLVGNIFMLSPINEKDKKAMYWLGYNLGRWIYLLDAASDLEKDIKNGSYNPFNTGEGYEKIRENKLKEIDQMLTFTLSEASLAYDLLNIKRYHSIIENILYKGLPSQQQCSLYHQRKEKRV